jgi:hypothetical protein
MTIKPSSAKAKGRKFQQYIAEQLSKISGIPAGKDLDIESREMGQAGTDIKLYGKAKEMFPYSIECKAQENLSIPAWVKQARANLIKGTEWLLFSKQSRQEPLVIMEAKHFFSLLAELLKLKGKV